MMSSCFACRADMAEEIGQHTKSIIENCVRLMYLLKRP